MPVTGSWVPLVLQAQDVHGDVVAQYVAEAASVRHDDPYGEGGSG